MSSVAVVFPTCNVQRATLATEKWRGQGYDVFVYLNNDTPRIPGAYCVWGMYGGWYTSCNILTRIADDYLAVVCAADDMDPEPNRTAGSIVDECYSLYGDLWVMQPVGDDLPGVKTICGSPWLSSEWRRLAYNGKFALPGWYYHQFGDNEMMEVTSELGVLHQREDLMQYHHHWIRPGAGINRTDYQAKFATYWESDKYIYNWRKARGWPEKELLA